MCRYWWYVGHLLGLDEQFLDIEDHAHAGELLDLPDSTTAPPDASSRALVGALFDASTSSLSDATDSRLRQLLGDFQTRAASSVLRSRE